MAQVVSGLIAVLLLLLYGYAIGKLVRTPSQEPSSQVGTVLTFVGGLVSALVVSVLSITQAKNEIGSVFVSDPEMTDWVSLVAWAYVSVWLICGLALLFYWMRTTEPSTALRGAAKSWLGLAVAAAYSYLGLQQP